MRDIVKMWIGRFIKEKRDLEKEILKCQDEIANECELAKKSSGEDLMSHINRIEDLHDYMFWLDERRGGSMIVQTEINGPGDIQEVSAKDIILETLAEKVAKIDLVTGEYIERLINEVKDLKSRVEKLERRPPNGS